MIYYSTFPVISNYLLEKNITFHLAYKKRKVFGCFIFLLILLFAFSFSLFFLFVKTDSFNENAWLYQIADMFCNLRTILTIIRIMHIASGAVICS